MILTGTGLKLCFNFVFKLSKKHLPGVIVAFPGSEKQIQIKKILCTKSQSLFLRTLSKVHDISNKRLYPDLTFVSFFISI